MRRSGFLLALAFVGCSQGSEPAVDQPDAALSANALVTSLRAVRSELPALAIVKGPSGAFDVSPSGKLDTRTRLPAHAADPWEVSSRGATMRVRLLGAKPVAARVLDGHAVYAGAIDGNDMVHVPRVDGTEEYVRWNERPEVRTLRYELSIEGVAGLRLNGPVLELLSREGVPLLRTTAPTAIDDRGHARIGSLRVDGCAYDASGALPAGRPVTAPGSSTCTIVAEVDDTGLTYPLWVDPAWTNTASLAYPRSSHSLTVNTALPGCSAGCVLVAGGIRAGAFAPVAEVWTPATSAWSSTAVTACQQRQEHAAVDVGASGVLLAGGANLAGDALATACVWNGTGFVATANNLSVARLAMAAGPMPAGTAVQAILAGGKDSAWAPVANVDVYSSATNSFTTATALPAPRSDAGFAAVGSAGTGPCVGCKFNVCVFGGNGASGALRSADCGPKSGATITWATNATALLSARVRPGVAQSYNGNIVEIAGGGAGVDRLDLGTMTFTAITTVAGTSATRLAAARITAPDGPRSLFIGGSNGTTAIGTAIVVDTATSKQSTATLASGSRMDARAGALPDNRVIVAGGNAGSIFSPTLVPAAELFTLQDLGAACSGFGECKSGYCADGVCCDGTCSGTCEACNLAGSVGTCRAKPADTLPSPGHPTCSAVPVGPPCGYRCDGANRAACVLPAAGTVCGAATCSDATGYTPQSTCDTVGACKLPTGTWPASCGAYKCNTAGSACRTSCTTFADCADGYTCTGGACVSTGAAGAACSITPDCKSGLTCVDGVCCTTASCSGGTMCNIPGAEGSCRLPLGATCTASTAATCGSGICVDGVCCNTACPGQCEACNLVSSKGTCAPVPSGGSPVGARTACSGVGACQAKCDGSTRVSCGPFPPKTTVCTVASCSAGVATDTSYCDGGGACVVGAKTTCSPYVCGTAACLPTCSTGADCATGYFCDAGTCRTTGANGTACSSKTQCASGNCIDGVCCASATCPMGQVCNANTTGTCSEPLGSACTTGAECGSGFCADGVCCNAPCTGSCESCGLPGYGGACTPVPSGGDAAHGTCPGTGACRAKCDGTTRSACGALPGVSTACAPASCGDSKLTGISYCDGLGTCTAPAPSACTPYICASTSACGLSCTTTADCATGYACKAGKCETTGDLGTLCDDASQCKSGKCTPAVTAGKTVCCSVDTCPSGSFCGEAGTPGAGTCVKRNGSGCSDPNDCASGFCVDSVCCDTACTGQCQACDVSGAQGKCSPVAGAPHGARPKCSDGGDDVCKARTCNGSDALACEGYLNGAAVECGRTCADEGTASVSRCDGAGSCGAPKSTACAGYKCASGACKTSCTGNDECATGYYCNATTSRCEPALGKCNDERTQSTSADGSSVLDCAPYRCDPGSGACSKQCASSENDCATGYLCAEGTCTAAPTGETGGDDGGCSYGTGSARLGAPFALILALGAVARVRRRQRGVRQ